MPGVDLQVVFCSEREPNRQWELPPLQFNHVFLKERFVTRGSNFIHNNPDVLSALQTLSPDVVITTGFNPTYLYAFAYALARGIPHVPMTDGTDASEEALSKWHKVVRRIVYWRSQAFIAASRGGLRLYASYGIPAQRCFQSCLCIDNDAYLHGRMDGKKKYDLIFCGRIVEAKNPLFTLQVAHGVAVKLSRKISVLFVGTGEQEQEVRQEAAAQTALVDTTFYGHAAQEDLPALYASARIFMFPTVRDVWGVVANEACAAGLPIMVSPHAGVVGELVVDGENGFVCELELTHWIERVALLLSNDDMYQRFALRSASLVSRYTFDHAAAGIVEACRYAVGERQSGKLRPADRKAG